MKKLLLFAGILLPFFASGQHADVKNTAISYYVQKGYHVHNEHNFTMRQGEKREATLIFEGGTDYVVFLVPDETGVTDSELGIRYSNGKVYRQWHNDATWEEIRFTTIETSCMKVKAACKDSYESDCAYGFSVVIMGKPSAHTGLL